MQIKGIIDEIDDVVFVTDKFRRRTFILVAQSSFDKTEYLKFELHQQRCDILDNFVKGDIVTVTFQIQGNKWKDASGIFKYFVSLKAWKIEKETSLIIY